MPEKIQTEIREDLYRVVRALAFRRIDRGQRERGVEALFEEEAMRLADEELHAMRRERRTGR